MAAKIYGTIGPACSDMDMLVRLFEKGMTGIRVNLSHTNLKDAAKWMENIHTAWKAVHGLEHQKAAGVEILIDLRGPELRIGTLRTERRILEGDMLTLTPEGRNNLFDPTEIPIPQQVFEALQPGQEILLDDGKISLLVEERNVYGVECQVSRGGVLKGGKSIALPGQRVEMPTLTESDLANIAVAKKYGITGVMLPFVRGEEDLMNLKSALKEADAQDIRIFAKIENRDGVGKLPELLPYCDEIVIARGDLGNDMPLWRLPVVQAQIAEICRQSEKPFMVVTQMLASMERAAVPTRAEVSDIFRAVREGAASVMLTGETATGEYPVEAMEYMVNTVREAETYMTKIR